MKTPAYIALLVLMSSIAFGQKRMDKSCQAKFFDGDPCGLFNCFVTSGELSDAYGLFIQKKTTGCSDCDFLVNLAKVFMSNKKFDEAGYILQDFKLACPQDPRFESEENRRMEMLGFHKNPKPVEIILLTDISSDANDLIGWLWDKAPVPLCDEARQTNSFPVIRKSGNSYILRDLPKNSSNKRARAIADKIDLQNFLNVGPGVMVDDSLLLFTAVEGGAYAFAESKGKLKIFSMDISKTPSSPVELPFCSGKYNDAYPAYDERNNTVIFASDRPGGIGGMDLWSTCYENGNWSEPILLGAHVNTEWNELFPYQYADTLYFSSNRPDMGYGGFDIYACYDNSGHVKNLGEPVNSNSNDFRVVFASETDAYFVSDRASQFLGDNIYKVKWSEKKLFFEKISGGADWLSKAAGRKVVIIDKVTLNQHTAVIGEDGRFHFHHIKGMSEFELQLPEIQMNKGDKLNLFAADGTVITELVSDGSGIFHFELLSPMDYYLAPMAHSEKVSLGGDVLQKILNASKPTFRNVEIGLLDSKGLLIGTTVTDISGAVVFKASQEGPGLIKVNCRISNANESVKIYDYNGNVLAIIQPGIEDVHTSVRIPEGHFAITCIGKTELSHENILKLANELAVYYDLNKSYITQESGSTLKKVADLLLENPALKINLVGHTDSRGSAAYNLELSEKRAQFVREYLVREGISISRIAVSAQGENMPVNHCKDGTWCSEGDHAANRRTELRISGIEAYTQAL